jgi:hypothetical protein
VRSATTKTPFGGPGCAAQLTAAATISLTPAAVGPHAPRALVDFRFGAGKPLDQPRFEAELRDLRGEDRRQ